MGKPLLFVLSPIECAHGSICLITVLKALSVHQSCAWFLAGILNVSAEDKTTGNKNKITITNDKGRLRLVSVGYCSWVSRGARCSC